MFSKIYLACGGLISDERGTLTTPGYPNRLIPYVQCTWEMRAEIGYRYLLEFEFLEKNGFYQKRYDGEQLSGCFSDLMYHNGKPSHGSINFRNERMFCDKKSTFISEADLVTLMQVFK
uniref:CUB domain-containing protein n=1 Tax=Heterorhabditis bacteriophora TaxID=37862 RepID=A0A1I7X9I6_HETBA